MFGTNWGTPQNNQNQQQQQQPNQPATGFGAFGQPTQPQTNAFGQPQQQQQPTSGFGGFAQSSSAFGRPAGQQQSAFGAFGSTTPAPTQTSGFGAFGAPAAAPSTTSAFGSTGAFGARPSGAFGAAPAAQPTSSMFGASSAPAPAMGTAAAPYSPYQEKDTAVGASLPVTQHFQTITAMPAYRNYSLEELRMQDYAQGRKTANQLGLPTAGFGAPAQTNPASSGFGAFGAPAQQQPSTSGFGAFGGGTGAFGQPQQPAQTSGFGGGAFGSTTAQPQTNAFGQPTNTSTSGFGAGTSTSTNAFGGGFGQQNQTQSATNTGFGAFGAPKPTTGFGAFGSSTTTPSTGFGAFGQPQQPAQPTTTAFGAQPSQTGFGGFGTSSTTSAFGQPAQQQQQPQSNIFGQPQQQQQQQENKPTTTGFGAFGGTNAFGQPAQPQNPQTNVFGQPVQQQQTQQPATTGFGMFGATNQQQQQPANQAFNAFAKPATAAPTSNIFGSFGQNQQNQQNQQPATSAFGTTQPTTTTAPSTGFGSWAPAANTTTQQPSTTNIFGAPKPPGSSLFGGFGQPAQQQQQQQQQPQTSFGGSLFGGLTTNTQSQPNQQPQPGGLFGGNSAFSQPNKSIFGNSAPSGSLFTGSTSIFPQQQNQQTALTASLDQNVFGNNPLLSSLGPGPHVVQLSELEDKKKPPPSPFSYNMRHVPKVQPPSIGRLRGFSNPPQEPLNISISRHNSPGISPEAFRPRSSVKKLMMPNRVENDHFIDTTRASSSFRASSVPPSSSPATFAAKSPQAAPEPSSTTAGKLKEGEYWTRPPIAELQKKSFQELSHLPDFTVGRVGFGEITFLDAVNLTSLKVIADIPGGVIEFTERSCIVYVDETLKPPPGEGLNVRARITLDKCWNTDRATGEWIKDVNHPRHKKLIRTLRTKENTNFISFDNETGTWVFTVEHFTRYGLDDDDDDIDDDDISEDVQVQPEPVRDQASHSPGAPSPERIFSPSNEPQQAPLRDNELRSSPPVVQDSAPIEVEEVSDHTEEEESDQDSPSKNASLSRPWPSHLGLDPRRVHVMQASLFPADDDDTIIPPPMNGLSSFSTKPAHAASAFDSLLSTQFGEDMAMKDPSDVGKPYTEPIPISRPAFAPQIFNGKYAKAVVPATKSVVAGQESSHIDAGLALGRSFRVGWGPGGTIVHLGTLCGPTEPKAPSAHSPMVYISAVQSLSGNEEEESENATRLLKFQIEHSAITLDERQFPRAVPNPDLRFHNYASLFSQDDQSHEASTWRLGEALFDEIDLRLRTQVSSDVRELIAFVRRKRALSDWLQKTVAPSVESYLRSHPNARTSQHLFAMLTGNQVERATETAMKDGDFHLATLLAQAGGDADFRADIEEQLVKWKDQVVDAHIDDSYRKIYSLLAGVVDLLPASNSKDPVEKCRELVIAEGLDWKRAFGLQLWFGTQLDAPTGEALDSYQSLDQELAPRPLPWYREAPSSASDRRLWKVNSRTSENDALYELIKLDADIAMPLEHALYPRGFSPSPLDFRLTWHLYILLSSCLRRRDFTDRPQVGFSHDPAEGQSQGASINANKVTASFASQLENQGLWELGVFVLLHLERSTDREVAVKAMISRNILKLTSEVEDKLTQDFNIPDAWIGEAKATLSQYQGHAFKAYEYYLQARLPQQAHDVAMEELAHEAILRDDVVLLRALFQLFNPTEVRDWSFRGKLYLDYVDCVTRIPELTAAAREAIPDATEAAELERLNRTVPQLIQLLPGNLPDRNNWRHNVCVARMLSKLLELQLLPAASRPQVPAGLVPEADRLHFIQTTALRRFNCTLQAVA